MKKIFFSLLISISAFANVPPCFLEGSVQLETYPMQNPRWLRGWVGSTRIELDLRPTFGPQELTATGWINDTNVRLDVILIPNRGQTIRGWIRNDYVNWNGMQGRFNGYQGCIR